MSTHSRRFSRRLLFTPIEAEYVISTIVRKSHTAMVLEGNTDRDFWSRHKNQKCELVPIERYDRKEHSEHEEWFNRDAVIRVIRDYYTEGNPWRRKEGAIGIVDQDYFQENLSKLEQHIFTTNPNCDLENILFHSESFRSWINQKKSEPYMGIDVFEIALRKASQIGILRKMNHLEKLHLKFKIDLHAGDIDWYTPLIESENIDDAIRVIVGNSKRPRIDANKIIEKYHIESQLLDSEHYDSKKLAQGHDTSRIFGKILNLGKSKTAERWARKNVGIGEISDSEIIRRIRSWEESNLPFKILVDEE